jgi:hypothetical protein
MMVLPSLHTGPITDVRLYLCRHSTASLEKTFYFMEKKWHVGEHDGCDRLLCYIDTQPSGVDPMSQAYAALVQQWVSFRIHAVARADTSRKLTAVDFCACEAQVFHSPTGRAKCIPDSNCVLRLSHKVLNSSTWP